MKPPIPPATEATPFRTCGVARCPACEGEGAFVHRGIRDRLYHVGGSWSVRQCHRCRSLWLDPRPVDGELPRCYPSTYFTHEAADGAVSADDFTPHLSGWKGRLRREVLAGSLGYRFDEGPSRPTMLARPLALVPAIRRKATHGLGPLLPPWEAGGSLLDVGCGNGAYLARMRAYGWNVVGQDVDVAAAAAAYLSYGIEVSTEALSVLADRAPAFDVVTASHVLEHVTDPLAFLRDAARCLRPGGRLIVVTPNASALGRRCFGPDWYPLDSPRHLTVFTPQGLRRVAESAAALTCISVRSLSRKARKVYRLGIEVRRHGSFRTGAPAPARAELAGRVFGLAEGVAHLVAPFGEELVLTARRAT